MVNLFSVPAFFIVLREVLEACLVVGIVLAYLNKIGNTSLRKYVIWGASAGIALSLVFGITFAVLYYTKGDLLFSGKNEKIFEGIVFLIAAALLTWMIIWMQQMGRKMQKQLEDKIDGFAEDDGGRGKWGLFAMVFVQVLREGIETWIFLFGATNASDDNNGWKAIPIPGILGVVVGVAVSYALFRGLVELDLNALFFWSSIILMLFSAGLTSHAFHEIQEVDWLGEWAEDKTQRDWWNARLWSTKDCCNDSSNQFFAFLRALFGYQDTPTFVEWSTYFAYWVLIIVILLAFNWSKVRAARSRIAGLTKKLTAVSVLVSFIAFIYVISNVTWHGTLSMTFAFLLSLLATTAVFDTIADRVAVIRNSRKSIVMISGISLAVLTLFMTIMHIALMACDEEGVAQCTLPRFYYVGLIFFEDWASQGRAEDGNSWVSLAVLSWSMVIVFFFFGTMAFGLIVYSGNINEEGKYVYDDGVQEAADDEEADVQETNALAGSTAAN